MYNGGKSECISELAKVLRGEPDVNTPKEMKFYEWEVGGEAFANHSRVHHHHSSVIIEKGNMTACCESHYRMDDFHKRT